MWRVFSRNIFLGRPKEAELTPLLTMLEPQDAAAPRSKPSAGIEPDACQHLAHMGLSGRQLNQQRGISSRMSEMLRAWWSPQITPKRSSTATLPTVGFAFTLPCGRVCTFAPSSRPRSSYYASRRVRLFPMPVHFSANKGLCWMSTLGHRYSQLKVQDLGPSLCPSLTSQTSHNFKQKY